MEDNIKKKLLLLQIRIYNSTFFYHSLATNTKNSFFL